MSFVDAVLSELARSDSSVVWLGSWLDVLDERRLALEHDVHAVWDVTRGRWAFSRGVPEEIRRQHEAEAEAGQAIPLPGVVVAGPPAKP